MHNDFEVWTSIKPTSDRLGGLLGQSMVHVWLLELDRPAWGMDACLAWLSDDERERAHRFHFARDRHRFIAGRGQLRSLLGAYLGCNPAAVKFAYGSAGKPHLVMAEADERAIEFNLSHSSDLGLLGVTRGRAIGVDIEAVRDSADLDDVARLNFAPAEQRARMALPAGKRLDAFFAIWSRKEAYLKAVGDGLLAPLDGFEVSVSPEDSARLTSIEGASEAAAGWSMWGGKPRQGFWAAVATEGTSLSIETLTPAP